MLVSMPDMKTLPSWPAQGKQGTGNPLVTLAVGGVVRPLNGRQKLLRRLRFQNHETRRAPKCAPTLCWLPSSQVRA